MPATVKTEIRDSILYFIGLIVSTIILDAILHVLGYTWAGLWLGPLGLFLILISFAYSARRRKLITQGKLSSYLRLHEFGAWLGSLLVLVHSGIHLNALIPWIATLAMVITTASGLTGKYLLKTAQRRLKEQKTRLGEEGLSPLKVEERLLLEARMVATMRRWRSLHLPITLSFALLVLTHLGGVFYYGWP